MFTLLFYILKKFFDEIVIEEKKELVSFQIENCCCFLGGYQKVFDPKKQQFLVFFCLSWHSRMTMFSIRLSSAASSSSLIVLFLFSLLFFITRNHKSILCNVWLWANSDHFCCCFSLQMLLFFLSIFFLSSFFHSSPHFLPQDWFCKWKRKHLGTYWYLTRSKVLMP